MIKQIGTLISTLLEAGPYGDADFTRAIKEGRADELLAKLDPVLRLEQRNLNFDNFAPYSFSKNFSGAGNPDSPYESTAGGTPGWLGFICLTTHDTEPTYQEQSSEDYYGYIYNVSGTVQGAAGTAKRFEEDQIEQWTIWCEADGREQINFRNRFLFLPSHAISSSIKSLSIYFQSQADGYPGDYRNKGRSARIRFKDSGGNPITIAKTTNQVFLVEYTWSLVTV